MPPSGATPRMRRPARMMTLPSISSRRIPFRLPTSSLPSGGIAALRSFLGGGSVGPLDPVAQAAGTTAGAGAAQVRMTGRITAAGQTLALDGSGVLDNKNLRAHLTFGTRLPGTSSLTTFEE